MDRNGMLTMSRFILHLVLMLVCIGFAAHAGFVMQWPGWCFIWCILAIANWAGAATIAAE